jgi:hypothetical protein
MLIYILGADRKRNLADPKRESARPFDCRSRGFRLYCAPTSATTLTAVTPAAVRVRRTDFGNNAVGSTSPAVLESRPGALVAVRASRGPRRRSRPNLRLTGRPGARGVKRPARMSRAGVSRAARAGLDRAMVAHSSGAGLRLLIMAPPGRRTVANGTVTCQCPRPGLQLEAQSNRAITGAGIGGAFESGLRARVGLSC